MTGPRRNVTRRVVTRRVVARWRRLEGNDGLTLVEVLIAVVIMEILAGIAFGSAVMRWPASGWRAPPGALSSALSGAGWLPCARPSRAISAWALAVGRFRPMAQRFAPGLRWGLAREWPTARCN